MIAIPYERRASDSGAARLEGIAVTLLKLNLVISDLIASGKKAIFLFENV